jgi:hypothetical protein
LDVIHRLPGSPAFLDEPAYSPISEIALRVLVEFEGGETHVMGTATLMAGHLAITAKHVLEDRLSRFGAQKRHSAFFLIDVNEQKDFLDFLARPYKRPGIQGEVREDGRTNAAHDRLLFPSEMTMGCRI